MRILHKITSTYPVCGNLKNTTERTLDSWRWSVPNKHCKTIVTAPHICYDHEKRSKQCGSIMNLWTVESSVDVYVCASQKLHCLMITAFLDPAKVPFRRPSAGFEAWVRVILSHLNAWWVTRFSRSEGAGYSSEVYAMWVIGSHQNYTDYLTYLTFVPSIYMHLY